MVATQGGGGRAESIVCEQTESRMFTITLKHDSEKVCTMTKLLSGCHCSTIGDHWVWKSGPFYILTDLEAHFLPLANHRSESKTDNY